jgi:hypothetical protein
MKCTRDRGVCFLESEPKRCERKIFRSPRNSYSKIIISIPENDSIKSFLLSIILSLSFYNQLC